MENMSNSQGNGEFAVQDTAVLEMAQLSFARGQTGLRYPLTNDIQKQAYAETLTRRTLRLTQTNTGDCGDDRLTIALANGITDPDVLNLRVVPQLFGGIGLATTKALIAANAEIIQGAKSVTEAYLIVSRLLSEMGEEDAGHYNCGASLSVESSVENEIPTEMQQSAIGLFVPRVTNDLFAKGLIEVNNRAKRRQLENGFYDGWNPENHIDYLTIHFPQNVSTLLEDPTDHVTHGHNGSGLYVVTQEGYGYQKDGSAFSVTLPKMIELANRLGGSDEERLRILIGFVDDTLHVGAGIVCPGFPAFIQPA